MFSSLREIKVLPPGKVGHVQLPIKKSCCHVSYERIRTYYVGCTSFLICVPVVESGILTLEDRRQACRYMDNVLGSYVTARMSVLGEILGGWSLRQKVHYAAKPSQVRNIRRYRRSLESQRLRNKGLLCYVKSV